MVKKLVTYETFKRFAKKYKWEDLEGCFEDFSRLVYIDQAGYRYVEVDEVKHCSLFKGKVSLLNKLFGKAYMVYDVFDKSGKFIESLMYTDIYMSVKVKETRELGDSFVIVEETRKSVGK